MTIRIRRWTLEVYRHAIYLTRGPNPDCAACEGQGGYLTAHGWEPDTELCSCWDPADVTRIPLLPRRTERIPF